MNGYKYIPSSLFQSFWGVGWREKPLLIVFLIYPEQEMGSMKHLTDNDQIQQEWVGSKRNVPWFWTRLLHIYTPAVSKWTSYLLPYGSFARIPLWFTALVSSLGFLSWAFIDSLSNSNQQNTQLLLNLQHRDESWTLSLCAHLVSSPCLEVLQAPLAVSAGWHNKPRGHTTSQQANPQGIFIGPIQIPRSRNVQVRRLNRSMEILKPPGLKASRMRWRPSNGLFDCLFPPGVGGWGVIAFILFFPYAAFYSL